MNYIMEIRAFYDWLESDPLSPSQICLWHALMYSANKSGWKKEFSVAIRVLESRTGLSDDTIYELRNQLKQKGLISWRSQGGKKSALYIMNSLVPEFYLHNSESTTQSTPSEPPSQDQANTPVLININETKLNETKTENDVRAREESVSERFNEFWNRYPRKTAKETARKSFQKLKPDDELLRTMLEAIEKQKQCEQWTKDGGQYIPHPATWLNQKRWEDETVVNKKANELPDYSDTARYKNLSMDLKKE